MKVVKSTPLRTGRLYPQEFSWYSFLEAESTAGHIIPSVAMEEILSDTNGDRSRDPPTASAVQEWYNLQTFHRGGLVTRWRRWCPAKEVNEFILRRRLRVLPAAFYLPITLMQSAISFSFSCWGEKMHLWKCSLLTELTIRHVKDVNGLSKESCANTEVLGENHVPTPVRCSQIAMTWDWPPWLHDQKPDDQNTARSLLRSAFNASHHTWNIDPPFEKL
jgi:hypothetical protein